MKNLIFVLLSMGVLFSVSCKKSPALPTTMNLIQNKWQVKTISTLQHKQGSDDNITTTNGGSSDYFDFRNDGKLYISVNNGLTKDTSNYSMISDNQFSINGSLLANITTLTSNALVFNVKTSTSATDYDQSTYNLTR